MCVDNSICKTCNHTVNLCYRCDYAQIVSTTRYITEAPYIIIVDKRIWN